MHWNTHSMTSTKEYTAKLYRGHHGPDDNLGSAFAEFLSTLDGCEHLCSDERYGFQIISIDNGFIFGTVKTYREDTPHIGKPAGDERPVDMGIDEYIIEKAFFLYSRSYNIMALQMSDMYRSPNKIAKVLNHAQSSKAIYFSSIVSEDALRRIAENKHEIKRFECSIALPAARNSIPADDWSKAALTLAEGAPCRLVFTLSGSARGTAKEPLEPSAVERIIQGATKGFLDKAKATTMDGEPIDLLSDRLSGKIYPALAGKHPMPESVKNELIRIFDDNKTALESYKP